MGLPGILQNWHIPSNYSERPSHDVGVVQNENYLDIFLFNSRKFQVIILLFHFVHNEIYIDIIYNDVI